MRRKVLLVLGVLIVLAIIGKLFILPMLDMEMMKAPLTNGLMALRSGDMRALHGVFTDGAVLEHAQTTVEATAFLESNRGLIEAKELDMDMRFDGFTNVRRESDTSASADFAITVYFEGEESGYHRVPIQKQGHVVLYRQGFMNWKIERLTSPDPEFGEMLRDAAHSYHEQ